MGTKLEREGGKALGRANKKELFCGFPYKVGILSGVAEPNVLLAGLKQKGNSQRAWKKTLKLSFVFWLNFCEI